MQLQFQLGKADNKVYGVTLGQIQKLKSARLVEQKFFHDLDLFAAWKRNKTYWYC